MGHIDKLKLKKKLEVLSTLSKKKYCIHHPNSFVQEYSLFSSVSYAIFAYFSDNFPNESKYVDFPSMTIENNRLLVAGLPNYRFPLCLPPYVPRLKNTGGRTTKNIHYGFFITSANG